MRRLRAYAVVLTVIGASALVGLAGVWLCDHHPDAFFLALAAVWVAAVCELGFQLWED